MLLEFLARETPGVVLLPDEMGVAVEQNKGADLLRIADCEVGR
jgi:hypothetical protein